MSRSAALASASSGISMSIQAMPAARSRDRPASIAGADAGVHGLCGEVPAQDAQTQRPVRRVQRHRPPGKAGQKGRGVRHAARQRSGVIEAPGQRKNPVQRHQAVAGLDPHDPAIGRRNTDRAAGIGADGKRHDPRRHRRRRPAAGPTGGARRVVRVVGLADLGMRHAIGVFQQVGLAQDHRPRRPQPGDQRGVARGDRGAATARVP